MSNLNEFLNNINLQQYFDSFVENGYDDLDFIKSRDEIETADTIHSAAPDTGDNTASAWYDALDLKEAIGHVERILELIQDGKN